MLRLKHTHVCMNQMLTQFLTEIIVLFRSHERQMYDSLSVFDPRHLDYNDYCTVMKLAQKVLLLKQIVHFTTRDFRSNFSLHQKNQI